MQAFIETLSNFFQTTHLLTLLLDALLKSLVVLALAGALCLVWRRASAAARHLIWLVAVLSLPFLPLLSSMLPSWQKPLWSVSTDMVSGNQISLTIEFAPLAASPGSVPQPEATGVNISQAARPAGGSQLLAANFNKNWLAFGFAAWSGGIVLIMLGLGFSQIRLRNISRGAQPLQAADWVALLQDVRAKLGLRRPVILLQSRDNVMPLTWGWLRPVVLLPAEAAQWPDDRRRVVLLHELAHVKRWDCLTQFLARIVCALYWFNPLVWIAARRMCVEREQACDDLVLNGGCKASDYAGHLVEIARTFRRVPQVAAIAMARPSGLEKRIVAIVDGTRVRRLRRMTVLAVLLAAAGMVVGIARCKTNSVSGSVVEAKSLRKQQIDRLKLFSAAKEKQAHALAAKVGEEFFKGFQPFFDAAIKGDWQTVTNLRANFMHRHPQYEHTTGDIPHVIHWQPVLEICLAYDHVVLCEPKYTQMAIDDMVGAIPKDAIYFGGTDPGRGLPTAFSKSHADGDPFFTVTQNALADGTYLGYLRAMYGGKIYTPTEEDLQKCFQDYMADVQERLQHDQKYPDAPKQVRPGENIKTDASGHIQVSGQVAVMGINGLLAKIIFDRNSSRDFYLEESFPLDWMYPHLEPHGLIMKLNREPLAELLEDVVKKDHDYWQQRVHEMVGGWLNDDTPVKAVTEFAEKVYLRKDLNGFTGDPRYVQNDYACKAFSKWRSSIGGIYAWRLGVSPSGCPAPPESIAKSGAERERMIKAADLAYRQAFALCPYSPEAVYRYVNFLIDQKRTADALLVAETASRLDPKDDTIKDLARRVAEKLSGEGAGK